MLALSAACLALLAAAPEAPAAPPATVTATPAKTSATAAGSAASTASATPPKADERAGVAFTPVDDTTFRSAVVAPRAGRIVVVNFWASYCLPCLQEVPALLRLGKERAGAVDVVFVGTDPPSDTARVARLMARKGLSFASFIVQNEDPEPFIRLIDATWGGELPFTVLYDRQGHKVTTLRGAHSEAEFNAAVDAMLAPRRDGRAVSDALQGIDGPVLFFDGVCHVCDASVRFILERERAPTLRFASLQSAFAARVLPPLGINPADLDSVVLVEAGQVSNRSTALLRVARHLRAPWRFAVALFVVPKPLRDLAYLLFARFRYRLFGRKDACDIPTPALRARFIEA